MRVFITGASGWIGSAVTDELLAHGHQVLGLARSAPSAEKLSAQGATIARGDLDDLESLRLGATQTDAVIHLGNKHDWDNPAESARAERAAVEAFLEVLAGTDKPFLLASGVAAPLGRPLTEADPSPHVGPASLRGGSEALAMEHADRVRSVALRFPPTVHGVGDHGFIAYLAQIARQSGVSGYVGDGSNRWPAVHVRDAARAVRLALEKATPGLVVHAVAEEGVPTREIAEGLATAAGVPTASVQPDHFGWLGGFFGLDVPASSARTRELLGWEPTGPTLAADLPSY